MVNDRYEYVDDPFYFNYMVDTLGFDEVAKLLGHTKNHIMQLRDGRRKVRRHLEFAAENWAELNELGFEKEPSKKYVHVFLADPESEGYTVISKLIDVYGFKLISMEI